MNWQLKVDEEPQKNLGEGPVVNLDFYFIRFPLSKLEILWLCKKSQEQWEVCICSKITKMLSPVSRSPASNYCRVVRIFSHAIHLGSLLLNGSRICHPKIWLFGLRITLGYLLCKNQQTHENILKIKKWLFCKRPWHL